MIGRTSPARAGPAVAACLAVVAGVIAGEALPAGPGHGPGAAGVIALAASLAVSRGGCRRALVLVALVCAGGVAMLRARDGLDRSAITELAGARAAVTLRGRLVGDPVPSPFTTRALVRLAGADRQVLAVAGRSESSRLTVLRAGDRVVIDGALGPLEGRDRRWRWRHAAAHLRVHEVLDVWPGRSPLVVAANGFRDLVLRGTDELGVTERGLVAGFLVGDTRGVPYRVVDEFRRSGLSHLLVVSGSNVAFVLALAGPALHRRGLRGRLVGGLAVLTVFGAATRWEPSVLRACAMAAISMLAAYTGRPVSGVRVLATAVGALLLVDPFLVHSVAFLLSCGASGGILLLSGRLARRLPGPRWLREPLAATAAAQVGVAPVLLPAFGSIPLVALPANVAVAAVAGPLAMWGMVSGVASGLVAGIFPPLAALLQVPTRLLVGYVASVASVASRVPVSLDAPTAVAVGMAAVAAALARRRPGTRREAVSPETGTRCETRVPIGGA